MSLISDIVRILTLNCRESSALMSESLDRPLRLAERIALRFHYIGCWSCRRLRHHLTLIRQAAGRLAQRQDDVLSAAAAERIKSAIARARAADGDSGN